MEDSSSISPMLFPDKPKRYKLALIAAMMLVMSLTQAFKTVALIMVLEDQHDSELERRRRREIEHECLPFMQNQLRFFGPPQKPEQPLCPIQ